MSIIMLIIIAFIIFAIYRYRKYQKQREIEEMATDAQAYVGSEIVELLQRYKTLVSNNAMPESDSATIQQAINNLNENLFCHTDSESSVREYLSAAKQEIALLTIKLDKFTEQSAHLADQAFDALK